jgi:hypothetical protein
MSRLGSGRRRTGPAILRSRDDRRRSAVASAFLARSHAGERSSALPDSWGQNKDVNSFVGVLDDMRAGHGVG